MAATISTVKYKHLMNNRTSCRKHKLKPSKKSKNTIYHINKIQLTKEILFGDLESEAVQTRIRLQIKTKTLDDHNDKRSQVISY